MNVWMEIVQASMQNMYMSDKERYRVNEKLKLRSVISAATRVGDKTFQIIMVWRKKENISGHSQTISRDYLGLLVTTIIPQMAKHHVRYCHCCHFYKLK